MLEFLALLGFAGITMSLITEYSKKFGYDAKTVLIILCVIVGAAYQAYVMFVDAELQEMIAVFVTSAAGTASLFYGYVIKPSKQ